MYGSVGDSLRAELDEIRAAGLYKNERIIESAQSAHIKVNGKEVVNMCANNYLGLSNNERLRNAAKLALDNYGLGLSSVRFICGTQTIHKQLEAKISAFLGKEDTILYTSCWDANGGVFETILGENDAVISDALNHASIIDGIRLCKAKRFRYEHNDLNQLREFCAQARREGARRMLIVTDGIFSMDGDVGHLKEICDIADEFQSMVMVDDSHATGFFGKTGRGSIEYCNVMDRVDIVTSTLGKALGGSSGGFTAARKEIVDMLRQRSRPYLFSNSLPPPLVAACIECLEMLSSSTALRDTLEQNTMYFRKQIKELGFTVSGEVHPISPVMLGDAKLAVEMADRMLKEGIYVIGFCFPVVPKGKARIRTQISAGHSKQDLDRALEAFAKVGRELGVIS